MKSQIILCSGGARSGKSEFAERLALATKGQKAYVATVKLLMRNGGSHQKTSRATRKNME